MCSLNSYAHMYEGVHIATCFQQYLHAHMQAGVLR